MAVMEKLWNFHALSLFQSFDLYMTAATVNNISSISCVPSSYEFKFYYQIQVCGDSSMQGIL